eukprot:TRINITY_DN1867_c0_g2_i2.p1 TRINITY_DN1867_c0_g2~~TRINITY_DN1867_c0_g2_i2.p1  ORF type:complete len:478 (+),score=102.68 TRINITY_DN1867_c0_g2_i2:87-1436(+)
MATCKDCGVSLATAPKFCPQSGRRHGKTGPAPGPRAAPDPKRQRCSAAPCDHYANDDCRGMCSGCFEAAKASGARLTGEETEEWLRRVCGAVPDSELAESAQRIDADPGSEDEVLSALRRLSEQPEHGSKPGEKYECVTCYGVFEAHEMLELSRLVGGCGHRMCHGCAGMHVDTSLAERKELQCPQCEKTVPDKLIGRLDPEQRDKAEQQRTEAAITKAGCLSCPRCELPSAPPENAMSATACGHCGCSFCPNCKEAPHAGYKCSHVEGQQRLWLHWQAHGQQQWQDAGKRELEERAQRLLADLEASERAMVGMCKMCTQCKARILHVSGCDNVRCGDHANPYGTAPVNPNFGCGAHLKWSACPAYVPANDADARARLEAALAKGAQQELVKHGVQCSMCSEEIRGLRFKCLSCPETNLCMECQQKQLGQCPSGAQPAHVFEILHDKEA